MATQSPPCAEGETSNVYGPAGVGRNRKEVEMVSMQLAQGQIKRWMLAYLHPG